MTLSLFGGAATKRFMRMVPLFNRAQSLGGRNWALLAEAAATLAGASCAIKLLPFRRVMGTATRPGRARLASVRPGDRIVRELRWAVERSARHVPWRTVCFQKGLALHAMLRRRGIPSKIHYGVRQGPEGLAAHVWVSLDDVVLLGGKEAADFACLATFPAGPES